MTTSSSSGSGGNFRGNSRPTTFGGSNNQNNSSNSSRPSSAYGGSGGGYRGQGSRFPRREGPPEVHRINSRITAREVRVVTEAGEQLGILQINEALSIAQRDGLDLVEVAPMAKPPVCKIMDYGKFKYKRAKKEAEARKKRTESTIKELRIRYRTDSGDLETKLKQAREFIEEGDKVKFSMCFKGREAAFMELGVQKIDLIVERLSDIAVIDERSPAYGRQIHIVFAPNKQHTAVKPKKSSSSS